LLLFIYLCHYALWDDEAKIELTSEGVLQTGDTSIVIGHNILAYRNGLLVRDRHDRSTPPLPAYLAQLPQLLGYFCCNLLILHNPKKICVTTNYVLLASLGDGI